MGYYKSWVGTYRKKFLEFANKMMTGNITVAQAHAERDEIVAIFNELGYELEALNADRTKAERELVVLQEKMRKINN